MPDPEKPEDEAGEAGGTDESNPQPPNASGKKQVSIEVSDHTLLALELEAAQKGCSVEDLLREILENLRRKPPPGPSRKPLYPFPPDEFGPN